MAARQAVPRKRHAVQCDRSAPARHLVRFWSVAPRRRLAHAKRREALLLRLANREAFNSPNGIASASARRTRLNKQVPLPTYLNQDEVRRLLEVIEKPRDRLLFSTIYLYGLRVSEARRLDRDDVDLGRRTIRITRSKGGISGVRPLFDTLRPRFSAYLVERRDMNRALFVGRQGRLSRRWIQASFRRYATIAGIPKELAHVHILRHAIATHLLDAGEGIDFVKDHLGHRSIESSLVYGKVSPQRLARAFSTIERSPAIVTHLASFRRIAGTPPPRPGTNAA